MSGDYPILLRRRAESMFRLAEKLLNEGEYDLAVFNAEYATQLYVKSILYRLSEEEWRGHSVRILLGVLALEAESGGLKEMSRKVIDFTRRHRRWLAELDEAHTRSIYGIFEYSRDQATALVNIAKSVIELIKKVESEVFDGS